MAAAEHPGQGYASAEALGLPSGFHATDPQIYGRRVPRELFAKLRCSAPIWWNPQRRGADGFDDEGFWVVSKHDDIKDISRRSDIFSSHMNGAVPRLEEGISAEEFETTKTVLISQDAPEHTKLRNLVSRLFTPRGMAALRDVLEQRAERIVRAALDGGEGEFVLGGEARRSKVGSTKPGDELPRQHVDNRFAILLARLHDLRQRRPAERTHP